jgi:hypothetical protein
MESKRIAANIVSMVPNGLINAWFKTERAKKHLDELNQFLDQYYLSFPGSSLIEENGQRILRVEAPEPHVWIFLIAGDFFSCLRAALDHAVWRIASLHVARPKDVVQFPIIGVDNKNGRERLQRQTEGLPAAVVGVIESLQPYNRPAHVPLNRNLLWCLSKINNIDKHRRITVHPTVALTGTGDPPVSEIVDRGARTFLFSLNADVENPHVEVAIMFGSEEDDITISATGLAQLHEYVSRIVLPKLAPFDP